MSQTRSGPADPGAAPRNPAALKAVDGLAFAASPTFALMAWVGASDAAPMALCSSSVLPMEGMTAMYLLMSLFHLSPWLKLASGHPWART